MTVVTLMVVMSMMTMNNLWKTTYSSSYNTYSRYRKSCLYASY
ncbi:hypothetical protein B4087_4675 [Bacillus cereus]|nr:hypothetical protein B4087_4675 [Bacillus cereus]